MQSLPSSEASSEVAREQEMSSAQVLQSFEQQLRSIDHDEDDRKLWNNHYQWQAGYAAESYQRSIGMPKVNTVKSTIKIYTVITALSVLLTWIITQTMYTAPAYISGVALFIMFFASVFVIPDELYEDYRRDKIVKTLDQASDFSTLFPQPLCEILYSAYAEKNEETGDMQVSIRRTSPCKRLAQSRVIHTQPLSDDIDVAAKQMQIAVESAHSLQQKALSIRLAQNEQYNRELQATIKTMRESPAYQESKWIKDEIREEQAKAAAKARDEQEKVAEKARLNEGVIASLNEHAREVAKAYKADQSLQVEADRLRKTIESSDTGSSSEVGLGN